MSMDVCHAIDTLTELCEYVQLSLRTCSEVRFPMQLVRWSSHGEKYAHPGQHQGVSCSAYPGSFAFFG
jgi:hypothetical protein